MSGRNVGVIGAGIVGLAHAWSAASRGHEVTVFDRSPRASGASIRNFGMVWPIGQTAGHWHAAALRSRARWLDAIRGAGLPARECGSIHLAHRDDEWAVLSEFAGRAPDLGYDVTLLGPDEVRRRTHAANPEGLRGGLFSPTEVAVDPPLTIRRLPEWLARDFGIRFEFDTAITRVADGRARAADGRAWEFDDIYICAGVDFSTLFPEIFADSGLVPCKLQMLRTVPQPSDWDLGTHLASGLTLRHYKNFEVCPSLPALRARVAREAPELDRFGIHVMASQDASNSLILGDSHEYGDAIEPFDRAEIDDLILAELRKILAIPDWTIAARWHGIYAKNPDAPVFAAEPAPGVHVRTGLGGSGMTMAFGLAELEWEGRP